MAEDFEERVRRAREANLALYLGDPSPRSARLMIVFERAVVALRAVRDQAAAEAAAAETINRGLDFLRKATAGATDGEQESDVP